MESSGISVNRRHLIVGIGHRKRTGKDYFAARLSEAFPKKLCAVVHIADALKSFATTIFYKYGLQTGAFYDKHSRMKEASLPVINKTPREIWIALGNALRDIYPNIWVDSLFDSLEGKSGIILVPDLRFHGEFEAIKAAGGLCIRVDAPGVPKVTDGADDVLGNLSDEAWDFIVTNDFNQRHLQRQVEDVAEMIRNKTSE